MFSCAMLQHHDRSRAKSVKFLSEATGQKPTSLYLYDPMPRQIQQEGTVARFLNVQNYRVSTVDSNLMKGNLTTLEK
jgi:hypothetical protein